MSDVQRISNGEIQTLKRCRRKWWLSYYRALRPAKKKLSGALALGSRVHEALAELYVNGADPLMAYDDTTTELRPLITDADELAEFDKDSELGKTMLEGYLEWVVETGADTDYEVTGVEQVLEVPLLDGRVIVRGKLDMRLRRKSDGRRLFFDHKTCASITDAVRNLHMDEQMLHYMLLERVHVPDDEHVTSGLYNLLRKVLRTARATPPFYQRVEAYHSDLELRNYWKRLHGELFELLRLRAALDAGADSLVVAYPSPTRECHWQCPHYLVCPLFDDGSDAEGYLLAEYEEHDPYEHYALAEEIA